MLASRVQSSASPIRSEFPVLQELAYLNAGTDGPLPARAAEAARAEIERAARRGRAREHFERRSQLTRDLREAYARILAAAPEDLSLTTCTSEGIALVIDGLGLAPGDEILTSDEEHPGLLGALAAARDLSGVEIRMAPLAEIHEHVGPATTLVACSHVSWVSGRMAPAEVGSLPIPVLLDGAQDVGAVAVDLDALGCDAYAGPGQKWLCGPDGLGMLHTTPELRQRLRVTRRGYANLADPGAGLESALQEDGRRLDCMSLNAETLAGGLSAAEMLQSAGLAGLQERAADLAEELVGMLESAGRAVAPRARGTLVSFQSPDPGSERELLAGRGVVLRDIPGRPLLRASVGPWNDRRDLERLLEALPGP